MGGSLIPVVCAAPLSKETMDRFIEENDIDEDKWFLVFVDSIDDYYDEASEPPREVDSDPNSPFIGKTPLECYELLVKLCEDTESDIYPGIFAIMDERSSQDDTVLLVCAGWDDQEMDDEAVPVETVRATFEVSATSLMCYHSGHSSVAEDMERARLEKDNVYRAR